MHIDWFTFIAQVLNFLLLVWLMKRFLYKPILAAIDEREQRIASQLQEAQKGISDAQVEREKFERLHSELEQQQQALLDKAVAEAKAERQRMLDAARAEYSDLRTRLQKSMREEQASLSQEIASHTQAEVFAVARQVLGDLAGTTLEEQMANIFIGRLREMKADAREQLSALLRTPGRAVTVRSAFPLPKALQEPIAAVVNDISGQAVPLTFLADPDQAAGIELLTDGYKLAWSIADYLGGLEKKIATLVASKEPPEKTGNHDA